MSPAIGTIERLRSNQRFAPTVKALPVVKGTLTPILSSYYTGQGMVLDEWPYYKLVNGYRSWVYTCIDKIAKSVALIPLQLFVYRNKKTGKLERNIPWKIAYKALTTKGEREYFLKEMNVQREEISDHPFLDLINRPNNYMTRFDLWYHTMVRLELAGLCGWLKVRDSMLRVPRQIWPLPLTKFAKLSPKVNSQIVLERWDYQDGDVKRSFKPDDIFLMKYPHPASPFQGMSPLMAQTYPYDIDLFLMQQQRALFEHGAVPGLHLSTEHDLTPDQVKEIREQIAEQYEGTLKSGETLVTHSGLRAEQLGQTGRDIMIGVVSEMVQDRLITAYDLSPGKVGLVKDVNRANGEFLDETFLNDCLKPRCTLIEESIEAFLLPEYDYGLTCDFDMPDYGDKNYKLLERRTNLETMYSSINQERIKEGLDPVPWGDAPWIPFTMTQPGATPPVVPPAKLFDSRNLPIKKKLMDRAFWTEEKKEEYWKIFVTRSDHYESLIVRPMRNYFNRIEHEVLQRLDTEGAKVVGQYAGWSHQKVAQHIKSNKAIGDININKDKEEANLVHIFTPVVRTVMKEVGTARMRDLSHTLKLNFDFNTEDPRAKAWLGSRMKKFSQEVTSTTFDEITRVLRDGFANGQSVVAISGTLSNMFDSWDKYRAASIARTETIAALNQSDLEAVYQTGVEDKLKKHWLTAGDERVRKSHEDAGKEYEKEGLEMDEPFKVGGDSMQAPGGGKDAGENVNCRCTLYYTEIQAEEEAPSEEPSEPGPATNWAEGVSRLDELHIDLQHPVGIDREDSKTIKFVNMSRDAIAQAQKASNITDMSKAPTVKFVLENKQEMIVYTEKGRTEAWGWWQASTKELHVAMRSGYPIESVLRKGDYLIDRSLSGTVRHEYGHAVWSQRLKYKDQTEWNNYFKRWSGSFIENHISRYANDNEHEFWAESFAFWTSPIYGEGGLVLPKEVEGMLERFLGPRVKIYVYASSA